MILLTFTIVITDNILIAIITNYHGFEFADKTRTFRKTKIHQTMGMIVLTILEKPFSMTMLLHDMTMLRKSCVCQQLAVSPPCLPAPLLA